MRRTFLPRQKMLDWQGLPLRPARGKTRVGAIHAKPALVAPHSAPRWQLMYRTATGPKWSKPTDDAEQVEQFRRRQNGLILHINGFGQVTRKEIVK